jgi:hypothetical protein
MWQGLKLHFEQRAADLKGSMEYLGRDFLLTVFAIEHVDQGFLCGGGTGGVIGIPILFLFRSFGTLAASRIQVLKTIACAPWALKPIFGIVSDVFYIRGYNKIPYIVCTLLWAIIACILIVFTWPLSPVVSTMLFFVLFLQIAVSDLLIEAKYAHKVKNKPEVNPDLMSFVHFGTAAGQLLSLVVTGLLIPVMPLKYFYLIPIPVFCATLYPICKNWIEDSPYDWRSARYPLFNVCCGSKFWYHEHQEPAAPDVPLFGLDIVKCRENWRVFLLGLIIVLLALVTGLLGLLNVPLIYLFVFSVLSGPLLIGAFFLLIDAKIAKIQTFTIIQNMCTIPLDGALFFFFTDNVQAYPDGPHFSDTFYVTGIGMTAAALYIVGIVIYNLCMTRWKFRHILLATNLLYVVLSLPNIVLFLRWNKAWGLPDQLFVLSTEALQILIATWSNMPLYVIMNQLCPKGVEATSYALLAGCGNLGAALSQYQGAFILDQLGIKPMGLPGESHQFDNLWIAGVISVALPILPICAIYFLIPDGAQTDDILGDIKPVDIGVSGLDEKQQDRTSKQERMIDEINFIEACSTEPSTSYTESTEEEEEEKNG